MAESNLTVLTVVENDPGLLELMIRSVLRFTYPKPKFIICDNGNNDERIRNAFGEYNNYNIVKNKPNLLGGSNRHGSGLSKIFPLVDTPKTAIVENDCIVLCKGWDDVAFPDYKMVAAKKGELAGQPFYHVCFIVFSTGLLRHDSIIDFRAGQDGNRSNRTYKPHEDVGWAIRKKVRADQVQLLDFIDCKLGTGKYFNDTFQSDEFHLNGVPLAAHFGRGSNIEGKANRKGFDTPKKQLDRWKEIAESILREEDK